jgi:hypothetical protein
MSQEDLRVRVPTDLRRALDELFSDKRISLVAGVTSIMEWFVSLDGMTQSMILGQIRPDPEIREILLQRMLEGGEAQSGNAGVVTPAKSKTDGASGSRKGAKTLEPQENKPAKRRA